MFGCEVQLSFKSLLGQSVLTLRLPSGLTEGDVVRMESSALDPLGDVNPLYVRIHVTA
jgi:hypothetical protein